MHDFSGKVALVTGAGRGLGGKIAVAFSALGASVAVNDINPLSADETTSAIEKSGGKASSFVFDIAKRMPVEGLVAQVLDQFGRIDYLVEHASVKPDAFLLEMDEWEFHRTLDVNLGGPFFAMQQVGRVMKQQGGGAIVNLISQAVDGSFHDGHAAYSATQAGLIGLTQAAARELAAYNIRVNGVYIGRDITDQNLSPGWENGIYTRWVEGVPEITKVNRYSVVCKVLFLCSHAASKLSGQVIVCGRDG